ncbi:MAG: CotH kinase family protein [Lachnospiraceae bacterium]|nr:CotH kinase family protein [Lachnospiraceae bacterium]
MVSNKYITKIIAAIMVLAVILCLVAAGCAKQLSDALGGLGVGMEYESELFDTDEIISIDILMDEKDWTEMLNSAMSEEYYTCDVVINGQTIYNVGIRPKGNTSLSAIAMNPDSDRYSFKLEFGHFVDGQTCFGLDKLILNNNYADATNMKEAIIYDMFQYIGAEASLYNYASLSLNGEYKGVYLALEGVEKSFMLRNFGTQDGELYKPDTMGMGGDKAKGSAAGSGMPGGGAPPEGFPGGDFDPENMPDMGDFDPENMPDMGGFDPESMPDMGDFDPENMPDMGDFDPENMPDRGDFDPEKGPGGGGFSMGGNGGANLNYTDDDLDSYSTIWEGALTGTSDADHRRVVTALKNISEGTDLEEYLDIDNVLRYMAVHTFSVNMDSLSGNMAHNYYLYEYDGKLNIFPWDYNLSFGGMSMGRDGSAADMINDAIDTPFDGTEFFDALLENEEYLEQYHEYLRLLTEEYVDGGRFEEVYNRIRSQIDELVETDPTAFSSYDEYEEAAEMLYQTVLLRAESIEGQLAGTIPATDDGQREDASSLIDASSINISTMGTFNMGGVNEENAGKRRGGRPKGGMKPPSFAGTQEQVSTQDILKNLGIYGILFVSMAILFFGFTKIKRRGRG